MAASFHDPRQAKQARADLELGIFGRTWIDLETNLVFRAKEVGHPSTRGESISIRNRKDRRTAER